VKKLKLKSSLLPNIYSFLIGLQKFFNKYFFSWFKLISKFKAFAFIIFIWKFHNLLYTLIAFLSVFVFNVDLKDFLSTVGLIYYSFYNFFKEFKLNIYSMFYSWFNPSSFDNLIKDIRSYVDNSNNRIKAFARQKQKQKLRN